MSQANNPYASWGTIAARAEPSERADFIRKTYLHLAGAVGAFAAIDAVLLNMPGVDRLVGAMFGSRMSWFIVIAAFMGVSYLANTWAQSSTSVSTQYLGLSLYVVAEAVIFLPLLYIAGKFGPKDVFMGLGVIPVAGILTGIIFAALTTIVFATAADFSFLRTGLMIAGFVAIGLALVCAFTPHMNSQLTLVFIAGMIVFASCYILYDTSNVLHHYAIGQHVAASLALFASLALLFWYVIQIVMRLSSRD